MRDDDDDEIIPAIAASIAMLAIMLVATCPEPAEGGTQRPPNVGIACEPDDASCDADDMRLQVAVPAPAVIAWTSVGPECPKGWWCSGPYGWPLPRGAQGRIRLPEVHYTQVWVRKVRIDIDTGSVVRCESGWNGPVVGFATTNGPPPGGPGACKETP